MSEQSERVSERRNYLSIDADRHIVVHDVAALNRRCS
jgi:hypothetical protein